MLSNVKKKHKKSLCTLFYIFFVAEKSIFGLAAKKAIKARCYSDKLMIPLRRALNKSCFQNRPTWVWKVRFRCLRWKYVWGKFNAWRCHVFYFLARGDGVMCQPMCQPVCQVKVFTSDGKLVDEALKRERKLNGALSRMGFVPRNKACLPENTFSCPELQIHRKDDLFFFYLKKIVIFSLTFSLHQYWITSSKERTLGLDILRLKSF